MKRIKKLGLLASLTLLAASQVVAGTSIGVQFLGRDGSPDETGNPGVPIVSGPAGVIPIGIWNPIDDAHAYIPAEKGESQPLIDSSQATTTVTLLFDCNDSWYNDVTPTNLTKPNAQLMNGIIKASSGGGVPAVLTFTNVPEGQYDLYVYANMNGDGTKAKFWDKDGLTTYYVTLQHQFLDNSTFVQGTNTDPNSPSVTNICNYVKFSNVGTFGSGSIGVRGQWISGNDGIGISALQLVNIGPPIVNTNPVAFLTQPVNRRGAAGTSNVTFSVTTRGPGVTYQWYKNTVLIPGATSASYAPVIGSGDNGAVFYVVAQNNVNSVQSSNAVLTVGQNVLLAGIDETLWFGATRATVEDGSYDTNPPDIHNILFTFSTPANQGDNFGERVSAIFVPKVTTNYTFFVTTDDDSDLFLSTDATPANKRMIAQEVDWSGPLTWLSNGGGTGGNQLPQKRSDQWNNGATVPFANGIPLVAGTPYYIEVAHHEGGGGDNVDVTFKYVGEPDPTDGTPSRITPTTLGPYVQGLNGGYVVITNQPQGGTVAQGQNSTLTVAAYSGFTGDNSGAAPKIFYQWQTAPKGSSSFSDIASANGNSYTTPNLALANDGVQYRVNLLAQDASSNSAIAVLNVISDTNPPALVGSGALIGSTQVGATFSKQLDPVTAGNPANYKINGVAATSATVLTNNPPGNSQALVQLTVAAPVTASYTLVVTGIKDLFGNTLTTATVSGTVINLTSTDIGSPDGQPGGADPLLPTLVNVEGPGAIDVLCNGNDIYNNADGLSFLWVPKTNSFDVKVRVASVQNVNNWSAGAVMVREGPATPTGGGWELARHYFTKVDYGGPAAALDGSGSGANTYEYNGRMAPGDPTVRETGNGAPGGNVGNWNNGASTGTALSPVPFPNAWIRIARVRSSDGTSDHLLGYSSTDGQTWSQHQDVDLNDANHAGFQTLGATNAGPWPSVCYVGLGSTSHTGIGNNNATNAATGMPYQCWVTYRDWNDGTQVIGAGPSVSVKDNGDGTISLTYTGNLYSSDTATGTFTLVSGASNPYKVTPKATGKATSFYRAGP